jgi:alkylation response protein AidB-like acyl-CoA dehydrogenase
VPVANLLGQEGRGFHHMMESLQQERLVLAIGAAAAARGCLELTVDHVNERTMFGKPMSRLQNTRFELAEMATEIQLAASLLDDLIPRHLAGERVVREVSMAKWWITDKQFSIADRCLQLFGGYGYMCEYPVSRHFVDARVQRIYGGANEVMKELIARDLGLA